MTETTIIDVSDVQRLTYGEKHVYNARYGGNDER